MTFRFLKISLLIAIAALVITTGCKKKINAEGFGGGNLLETTVNSAVLRLIVGLSKMLQGINTQMVCDYRYSAESNLIGQQLRALNLNESMLNQIRIELSNTAYLTNTISALSNARIRVVKPGPEVMAYGSIQKAVTKDGVIYFNEDTFPMISHTELLALLKHESGHLLGQTHTSDPNDPNLINMDYQAACTAAYVNFSEGVAPSGSSGGTPLYVFQDTFTRANASSLGSSWNFNLGWPEQSGSASVVNNTASAPAHFTFENRPAGISRMNSTISTIVDLRNAPNNYGWFHLHARVQSSTTGNRYSYTLGRVGNSMGVSFYVSRNHNVAPQWQPLASYALPETNPAEFRGVLEFTLNGTTLIGKWKGQEVLRYNDSEILNSGSFAIHGQNVVIDDYTILVTP